MKNMNKVAVLKTLGVIFSFTLLQGCGDSYPEVGKFSGGNFSAKNISQYSTVYALEPSEFENWKSKLEEFKDLSALSESELLALQHTFSQSPLIKKSFASKPLLVAEKLDLDKVSETEYGLTAKETEQVKSAIVKLKQAITDLENEKNKADNATNELIRIKSEIIAEREGLLSHFNTLKTQSAELFKQYSKKDTGSYKAPKDEVLKGKPFDYISLKQENMSCRDYAISKNKWQKERYQTYLYSNPIKVGDKTYCPIFKTMGNKTSKRKALLANLSEADKSLLMKTATANVIYKRRKSELKKKERNVYRDNPNLAQATKGFNFKQKHQLSSLIAKEKQANQKLAQLALVTKEKIKEHKIKQMTALLERAKSYYLFESLQNELKKESVIQPDGTFTLQSGSDYYLIEVDPTQKTRPRAAQYALVRMDQFKNKELVTINSDAFFSFSDLSNITL